ncbi:MAG TPA: 1-deoxy-D-xylulose-5-phosphate reductoisomerase, partial [Burkholderiaceae bacterium]|nr:1-deoxy-D-xylulose-5-phosphate reductoisomerase [Burkholderiaceae bacterium]
MNLTILGATGSIGRSTLDVVARHPERYRVHALVANRQHEALAQQCLRFAPRYAVLGDPEAARQLRKRLAEAGCATEVLGGAQAAVELAAAPETDVVMAAVVGGAGLE